jgi:hypothetical protein
MPSIGVTGATAIKTDPYLLALDLLSGVVRAADCLHVAIDDRKRLARQIAAVHRWHRAGVITGFGLGPKLVNGHPSDAIACRLYLRRKRPQATLRPSDRVPAQLALAGFELPILMDVIERPDARLSLLTGVNRPIFPGISAGHCSSGETGSIGAACGLAGETDRFLLGASHVFAVSGLAARKDPIIQPGRLHGGSCPSFTIGSLEDFVRLVPGPGFPNLADAALVRLVKDFTPASGPLPINRAASREQIREGQVVKRLGCMSGTRTGTISDLHFRTFLPHPVRGGGTATFGFGDQILYNADSLDGDSGGPVVSTDGALIGIHVGRTGLDAIATPIWNIQKVWQLTF